MRDAILWNYDDFTQAGRIELCQRYLPTVNLVSIVIILATYYIYTNFFVKEDYITANQFFEKSKQNDSIAENGYENEPFLQNNNENNYSSIDHDNIHDHTKDNIYESHFNISQLVNDRLSGEFILKTPNLFQKFLLVLEFLLTLCQFCLNFIVEFSDITRKELVNVSLNTQLWLLLTIIVSLRIIKSNYNPSWLNKLIKNDSNLLWNISFLSYSINFICFIFPMRSILIHHIDDSFTKHYYIYSFTASTILFSIVLFNNFRDTPNLLYKSDKDITPSPETDISIANFVCWSWLDKFVWKANQNYIQLKDIWGLMVDDYSILVLMNYKSFTKDMKDRSFAFRLLSFFWDYFLIQWFWAIIGSFITFVPTLLIKKLLEYVENPNVVPLNLAWIYVLVMFAAKILVSLTKGLSLFYGRRVCIRMKSIIISEIYAKALRRKVLTTSRSKASNDDYEDPQDKNDKENIDADEESSSNAKLGTIINLMAIDAFKISEICAYLHAFVEVIIMTVVALTLLYRLLGFAAFIGTLMIVVVFPINFKLTHWLGKLQKESLKVTDKRIQKLNETFQAIRIIKFFSWEDNFEKEVNKIRDEELSILIKRTLVWILAGFVWFITPTLVSTTAFAYYVYVAKNVLTTPVAFTALSLFALLRDPLDRVSDMLSFVIQSKVSLDRVDEFLKEEDTNKYIQLDVATNGDKLAFEDATIAWDSESTSFKLRNLNIDFKIGKLNVVIGPTGSGKTSLLMGLLGEMQLTSGRIIVPSLTARHNLSNNINDIVNSIAYCSQAAWLLNDTVRNNILFDSPYDENRYNGVVKACGLERDFEILKAGDMTEIGEKGITLSGGQKQRVSLARALYSNAKHLLLDDCLSAVDSHTAAWIYDNCITGPYMEGRTCILVSHNIALTLRNADLVVILENGFVKNQGSPEVLLDKGLLGEDQLVRSSILSRNTSMASIANNKKLSNTKDLDDIKFNDMAPRQAKNDTERAEDGKLIDEETKAEGVVSVDVYKWYIEIFGGIKVVLLMASIFLLAQGSNVIQAWWLRNWASSHTIPSSIEHFKQYFITGDSLNTPGYANGISSVISSTMSHLSLNNDTMSVSAKKVDSHSTAYYLSIYLFLGFAQSGFGVLKTFFTYMYGIYASRKIFRKLLKTILHAKVRFFDTTPIGRIMNRFSKDLESTDQELMPYLHGAFYSLVECITIVFLITFITPQFIVIALVVTILYYFVGLFYIAGSRELKRFDSITKSPIYQHFSETLVGVTTIRAFGDEIRFIKENLEKIDANNKPFFYLWVANRWLSFRVDLVGALVVLGAGIFILLDIDKIDVGLAGISITYAISFTEGALWLVRFYSEVEMNMNSVERLKEYMHVEQEPYEEKSIEPNQDWPKEGKIEINDLSLRYAPQLPRVIKNVSFTVNAKTKIGIVGRTGAGKSTIITALFRFMDYETGYIKIDNIDITSVDLRTLRGAITIIPQDPTLFAGTIKSNLDPYGEFFDNEIFAALRRVNLVTEEELLNKTVNGNTSIEENSAPETNVNKFLNLDNEISENGSNLSQGQRQLMCLARSLLRSPKILLLDEATASIDYQSDAKIQETIRKEFSESTILTIAHRLRSVIDYDKILVLDNGELKEYDHPYSLLLDKQSIFYDMCSESGELDTLIELAKHSFVNKLNGD